MAGEQPNYQDSYNVDPNLKLHDLEEKQRILKNQLLLIGQNLIEFREKNNKDLIEIKKGIEIMKSDVERFTSFLDTASEELQKFVKKDDFDILAKQMRMFQPLGRK